MKFSIIIPVYNIENYLSECMESIAAQTFHDYEVILVDDGSMDNSGKLCDSYAEHYRQFRVFHQENKGLSVARNKGIELAEGEYILFVDGDDYLGDAFVLERLASEAEDCDIVTFAWKEVPDGRCASDYEACGKLDYLKKEYKDGKIYLYEALKCFSLYPWYSCRYAYNKKFWDSYAFRFTPGIRYEDVDLTYQIILKSRRIKVLADCVGYIYRTERQGSIVTEINVKTYCSVIDVIAGNIEKVGNLSECSPKLKERLTNNFSCLYYAVLIQSSRIQDRKEQRRLWDYLKKYNWICNYTKEPQQRIVKKVISMIGIPNTARLLGIRRKIQQIGRRQENGSL